MKQKRYKNIKLSEYLIKIQTTLKKNSYKKVSRLPILWLFTDSESLPDPIALIKKIPAQLNIGVVFRHYNLKDRYILGKKILKVCRKKNFFMIIGADKKLATSIGADGVHYPKWIKESSLDMNKIISCSVHGMGDLRRVQSLNANLAFLSPIYPTQSHLNENNLGILRASMLLHYIKIDCVALGGINLNNINSFKGKNFTGLGSLSMIANFLEF